MERHKSEFALVSAIPAHRAVPVSWPGRVLYRPDARSIALALALVASLWPLGRADAQESDGAASAGSTELVQPSLGGTGQASDAGSDNSGAPSDDPGFAQGSSGTFAFNSGFRGDCRSPGLASGAGGGLVTPTQAIVSDSGSRYVQVSLGASETYTDNLNRDPSGQEESDFITEFAPRFDACASSGRIQGVLSYTPQFVLYANNSEFNDIYNTISGQTTMDIWPGHFYLDADTRYGQSVVDPSINYSQSNTLAPGNQTTTWTSNISPYAVQSFGPVGTAVLRYRYGKVLYDDDDVPDSTINGAYLTVTSPPGRGRLSWTADAQTQKVERDGGDPRRFFAGFDDGDPTQPVFAQDDDARDRRTTYFDRASLELGYQATRLIKLIAIGGVEDDYQEDGTNDRWSSEFWSAGARVGTQRNTIEARVGHRFYGTSYFLSASHRGPLFNASVSYDEQPTTAGLNALNNNGRSGSIPGAALGVPVESQFDRGTFVEKRVSAQVGFDMARTSTGLTVYRRDREYVASGIENETYKGASLETRYQLQPRLTLVPAASWQNREPTGDGRFGDGYDTYETGVTLIRDISRTSQGAIGYAHAWRDSDRSGSDYRENRVTLQFLKTF